MEEVNYNMASMYCVKCREKREDPAAEKVTMKMVNQLSRANAQSAVQECTKSELPNPVPPNAPRGVFEQNEKPSGKFVRDLEDPSKEYYPSRDNKKPLAKFGRVFYWKFYFCGGLIYRLQRRKRPMSCNICLAKTGNFPQRIP